jgi:hypothetical protein
MLRYAHGEEQQRPIAFQRSDDEEQEEERGEEEGRGEEADNVGEGSNEEDEAKLEHVPRQTQRSHVVAPPIAPAREEDLHPVVRVVVPVTISTR